MSDRFNSEHEVHESLSKPDKILINSKIERLVYKLQQGKLTNAYLWGILFDVYEILAGNSIMVSSSTGRGKYMDKGTQAIMELKSR